MYNHRDVLGIVFNIIIILLLLSFIVVGLNLIGVYDLPDPVERILGTYKEAEKDEPISDNEVVDYIVYENSDDVYVTATDITYENARTLLENIYPANNYSHELMVEYYVDGNISYEERISVVRKKALYTASVYDSNSKLVKTIKESDKGYVLTLGDNSNDKIEFPKGTFDISDECGFILTAENFLSGEYALDEASFTISNGAYGGEITIVFDTVYDEYIQKEKYVISLDFGAVISAECYEDNELVYKMKTKTIAIG